MFGLSDDNFGTIDIFDASLDGIAVPVKLPIPLKDGESAIHQAGVLAGSDEPGWVWCFKSYADSDEERWDRYPTTKIQPLTGVDASDLAKIMQHYRAAGSEGPEAVWRDVCPTTVFFHPALPPRTKIIPGRDIPDLSDESTFDIVVSWMMLFIPDTDYQRIESVRFTLIGRKLVALTLRRVLMGLTDSADEGGES